MHGSAEDRPGAIDPGWTAPLNGKVDTCIRGFESIRIDEIVRETVGATHKHLPPDRFSEE